jgi:phage tail-like protein
MDNNRSSPYYFVVEIDNVETTRFQRCEGLEMIETSIEIEEGGLNTKTHKFIGKSHFPNIILEKGVSDNNELLKWYQQCVNGNFQRKNGSIVLKNAAGEEIKRWNIFRAFPCRWVGPKLDYTSGNQYAIETIELAYEEIILDETVVPKKNLFHVGQDISESDDFTDRMTNIYYFVGSGIIQFIPSESEPYLWFDELKKVLYTTNTRLLRDRYLSSYGGYLKSEELARSVYRLSESMSNISRDEAVRIKSLGGVIYLSRNQAPGRGGYGSYSAAFYFQSNSFKE